MDAAVDALCRLESALRAGSDERGGLALTQAGFVILAHEHLGRVAELARYLSLHGPVVIHVDRKVSVAGLTDLGSRVEVISTQACRWGMISLVDATLDSVRLLLERHEVGHICLLSGSCLPIRPLEELLAYLGAHPDTDFIDSTPVDQKDWVQGGLSAERFQYWFPLNWKTHRKAFDQLVLAQRGLGVRRKMPDGLVPHLGLQWWCLTAATLRTMLSHPRLKEWRRYFKWTWIPDESFFQSLVHELAEGEVRAKPLTLQRFDADGRPFVFHDDHADLLKSSGYFFARKIDPDAEQLYAQHLRDLGVRVDDPVAFDGDVEETPFYTARDRYWHGGKGLLGASKMTSGTTPSHVETVRPYAVIVSRNSDLMRAVRNQYLGTDIRFHGHLFGVFPTAFAPDFPELDELGPGCLPTDPVQRDYRPAQFLAKVLWVGRDRPAAFLLHPADQRLIRGTVYSDPNARLILLGDAQELLTTLGRPLRNKKGRPMRAPQWRAWYHAISTEAENAVSQALAALSSDWEDPSRWIRPENGQGRSDG